jgi:hypothetical protein
VQINPLGPGSRHLHALGAGCGFICLQGRQRSDPDGVEIVYMFRRLAARTFRIGTDGAAPEITAIPEKQLTGLGKAQPFHGIHPADEDRLWVFLILGQKPKAGIFPRRAREEDRTIGRIVGEIVRTPLLRLSVCREFFLKREDQDGFVSCRVVCEQVVTLKNQNISRVRAAEPGNLTLVNLLRQCGPAQFTRSEIELEQLFFIINQIDGALVLRKDGRAGQDHPKRESTDQEQDGDDSLHELSP